MTIGARVELGIRTGYATDTTCKIAVASLADGDVVISGTWGTTTITAANMVAIGSPVVGYTGSATITGLTGFTRYDYTATQGSKTSSGSFMTAPGLRDDFSLFFASCDCNTVFNNPDSGGHVTGFWDKVHDYALNGALPTVGVLFVDDHGYVDYNAADDTANTGLAIPGVYACYFGDVREYAIAYMANLGMLGHATQIPTNKYVAWGRDVDRVWCNKNLNYLPQWGDHEFINDFGFDYNKLTATSVGSAAATGVQIWAAGKAAWDAFMYPLMPTPLDGGYGWAMSLGCVNLIAPDGITNATGEWNRTDAPGVGTGAQTAVYGTTQIDAILTYLETPANNRAFNIFGMSHSIRYLASTGTVFQSGGQHGLWEHCLAEYQRMFTASGNSPKSIMENPATNGVAGVTVLLHGDYHHASVVKANRPAYTGNLAENYYSVNLGTISGSTNFDMPLAVGGSYQGSTLVHSSGWNGGGHDYAGVRVDVYGSRSRPELHVTLMDATGAAMWAGKWLARSSNEAMALDYTVPGVVGTSSKASI